MDMHHLAATHPWFPRRRNEYIRWYPKSLRSVQPHSTWNGDGVDGAYIHVPFCDRICQFCPFNKRLADPEAVGRFVRGVCTEVRLLRERLKGGPLRFIYFGGGTPSVLSPNQLSSIIETLVAAWGIDPDAEVSLEVHPSHATVPKLRDAASVGVNRVSMGIQSFREEALRSLGATHSAAESAEAVRAARAVFSNFAIDLLYAYGGQTAQEWVHDLEVSKSESVPHLSCYALVPIDCKSTLVSEQREIELAVLALQLGASRSLGHYASCASGGFDMCVPGFECRYELEHWSAPQRSFVGLGPGAFGFAGGYSTVNRLSDRQYANQLEAGNLPLSSLVKVEPSELRRRYFVLGIKGLEVPLYPYRARFRRDPLVDFRDSFDELTAASMAEVTGEMLRLTPLGRLFVDSCSSLFFSEAERAVPHPEEPELRQLEAAS